MIVRILTMGTRRLAGVIVPGVVGRIGPWVVCAGWEGRRAVSAVVRRILVPLLGWIGSRAIVTAGRTTSHARGNGGAKGALEGGGRNEMSKAVDMRPNLDYSTMSLRSRRPDTHAAAGTEHPGNSTSFSAPTRIVTKHVKYCYSTVCRTRLGSATKATRYPSMQQAVPGDGRPQDGASRGRPAVTRH